VASQIAEAVQRIRAEIAEAAHRAGRSSADITLVAVTKTRTHEEVAAAIEAGVCVLGENKVQEAVEKVPLVAKQAEWHLIGHLQTNKARQAVRLFDMIQSVDSGRLATKLSEVVDSDRRLDVLVEVNTSGEESKFGVSPDESAALVETILGLPNLRLRGFMTIGALSADERRVRTGFRVLQEIALSAKAEHPTEMLDVLSMGMTSDFRWAISEGSTMVRIGTAIFGERDVW
jgi:hypothetical protein